MKNSYTGCARAVAYCFSKNNTIIETNEIEFKERFNRCEELESEFCKLTVTLSTTNDAQICILEY